MNVKCTFNGRMEYLMLNTRRLVGFQAFQAVSVVSPASRLESHMQSFNVVW